MSRPKRDSQRCLDFVSSDVALTNEFRARYDRISDTLDACPEILNRVDRELQETLDRLNEGTPAHRFRYTSENILRMLLVQTFEGLSLREAVVRIDDSQYFPVFVRLGNRPIVSYSQLDRFKNALPLETWKYINSRLAAHAVRKGLISGETLRLDTTAVETNIHYPTDSSLLWDSYRVIGGLIKRVRKVDPDVVGKNRLRLRDVKRHHTRIARKAGKKGQSAESLKPLYLPLIADVEGICGWTDDILGILSKRRGVRRTDQVGVVEDELRHYVGLARRVLWQTRQRILEGAAVPSDQKVYSIHESHTELLIRGKAGKHIEYGHMIGIQQVAEKFITDFEVFEQKPVEYELLEPALESHRKLFGAFPDGLTGDKAYWEGPRAYEVLSEKVPNLSIAKKGSRTQAEDEREHSDWFSALQAFRAGIEGTISCLKRGFRLARCLNKGWRGYGATVGMSIVAHNLLLLAKLSC